MNDNLNSVDCRVLINKILEDLNLPNSSKSAMLEKYLNLLQAGYNKRKVTGEKNCRVLLYKQIYDSLYLLHYLEPAKGDRIIDLGSGGGLPGIPLKIFLTDQEITLLDANIHKAAFLKNAIRELTLVNIKVLYGRSEVLAHEDIHREQYDYLVCKAVAEAAVLAELALPFLKIGGSAYFYKGPQGEEELLQARGALEICGGEHIKTFQYNLMSGEERFIYKIVKTRTTPLQYPRAPGKPAKRPLTN